MFDIPDMEVRRSPMGYYTLFVKGAFEGNYDTYSEAVDAYGQLTMEPVSA